MMGDLGTDSYNPNPLVVTVGATVTWINNDSNIHTATSRNGIFNSEVVIEGQTFSHTFESEGEYQYFCDIHPGMLGTVEVKADGSHGS
jgi:plastocyanin